MFELIPLQSRWVVYCWPAWYRSACFVVRAGLIFRVSGRRPGPLEQRPFSVRVVLSLVIRRAWPPRGVCRADFHRPVAAPDAPASAAPTVGWGRPLLRSYVVGTCPAEGRGAVRRAYPSWGPRRDVSPRTSRMALYYPSDLNGQSARQVSAPYPGAEGRTDHPSRSQVSRPGLVLAGCEIPLLPPVRTAQSRAGASTRRSRPRRAIAPGHRTPMPRCKDHTPEPRRFKPLFLEKHTRASPPAWPGEKTSPRLRLRGSRP